MIHNKINPGTSNMGLSEKDTVLQDESGYRLESHEVSLGEINLKWGKYNNPTEKVISFYPDKTTVVSHFRITHPSPILNKNWKGIAENQFVVYQEKPEPYDLFLAPTKDRACHFFEVGMCEPLFNHLFTSESDFLFRFSKYVPVQTPSLEFTAAILPRMHAIIHDMYHTTYHGHLKDLYLEAKTIELFLLQVVQLDHQGDVGQMKLKKQDIECLHDIKQYIELNFDQPLSIAGLSRKAGINQMKLKTGFKQLFHTTVFGYLHSLRMQEAKKLLVEENMSVNEVAGRAGYKHPHHFTTAFKKEFNVTPSRLLK